MSKLYQIIGILFLLKVNILYSQANHPKWQNPTSENQIKFENFTKDQGLSNNEILDIIEDKFGYIWIATKDGLNRFDGRKFKIFQNNPSDFSSISSNYITDIEEDKYGNLWIGTNYGLNYYNRKQNLFLKFFSVPGKKNSLSNNHIRALLLSKNGNLYIETTDGVLNQFNLKTKEFSHYKHTDPYQYYYNYHSIFEVDSGLWIGGRNICPHFFHFKTLDFHIIAGNPTDTTKKRENDVANYFLDSHKRFWITGLDGAYIMNREEIFTRMLSGSIYDIIETQNGTLWFATAYGIIIKEKNQNSIKAIKSNTNPNSLISNHVNCLLIDRYQNIWAGTNEGLSVYQNKSDALLHFNNNPLNINTLSDNHILAIEEDTSQNILYIGTKNGGLNVFRLTDYSFEHVTAERDKQLISNKINSLKLDQNRKLWIGHWSGLGFNKMNLENGKIEKFTYDRKNTYSDWYSDFADQNKDRIWIGLWGAEGLALFDKTKNQFIPLKGTIINSLSDYIIQDINYLNKYKIIYFANNQLHIFESDQNNLKRITQKPQNQNDYTYNLEIRNDNYIIESQYWNGKIKKIKSIHDNITAIETTNGLYLRNDSSAEYTQIFGSSLVDFDYQKTTKSIIILQSNGILIINLKSLNREKPKEIKFPPIISQPSKLILNEKGEIFIKDKNKIHEIKITENQNNSLNITKTIAIENSANRIQIYKDKILYINNKNLIIQNINSQKESISLAEKITGISRIYESKIIIATAQKLFEFDISTRNLIPLKFENLPYPIEIDKIIINHIYIHTNQILYLATNKGLMRYNKANKQLYPIRFNENDYTSKPVHLVNSVLKTGDEIYLTTTKTGLKKYNIKTQTIQNYESNILDYNSLWGVTTTAIFQSKSGEIYIGGYGLNILNPATNQFMHFTTDHGLPSNEILGIAEDKNGNLWISTNKGLSVYNTKFQTFKSVTIDISKNLDYTKAIKKLHNNQLFIGTKSGFYILNPDSLTLPKQNSNLQITNIIINNIEKGFDPSYEKPLKLKPDEKTIMIEFLNIGYANYKEVNYEYRLLGLSKEWIKTQTSSSVNFAGLAPGNYIFELRTIPDNQFQKTETIRLNIQIESPFYKKSWFIIVGIILLITPLIIFLYLIIKQKQQENEKLILEQKLLRSQMNPHFIFNSLGAIQNYILNHNPLQASIYLSKFSDLIRQILQNSREEKITLSQELTTLTHYLELQMLRFDQKFDYKIQIAPNISTNTLLIPPMLGQPFIENAIEHGFKNIDYKGHIVIDLKIEKQNLIYSIIDNGIGIHKSINQKQNTSKHRSLATIISKNRLTNLQRKNKKNYSIEINDLIVKELQGTEVVIKIALL